MSVDEPRVYLTRALPPRAMARLESSVRLDWHRGERPPSWAELESGLAEAEALLCFVTDRIDDRVLAAAPRLRVVANVAVGYDNIDVEAATRRGIVVTNTPGTLTETTADLAFALLLAVARRVVEGDRLVREGEWRGWGPTQLLGRDIHGAVLGIVGLGRIGRAVAARGRGFGMRVRYWNRTRLGASEERELGVEYRPLEELLASADFVSLHVAYCPDTHHLLDERRLRRMRSDAYLINTSRGAVVDEAALVVALRQGQLAGAGLDVYEREPRVPAELVGLDNTVLLPHLGSASIATRERMAELAIDNVLAVLAGDAPPSPVNRIPRPGTIE